MYQALKGNYAERSDDRRVQANNTKNSIFSHTLDRPYLEAIVLIPEDAGVADIKREYIQNYDTVITGIKLSDDALSPLVEAHAKVFSEPGTIQYKNGLLFSFCHLFPGSFQRFKQYRDEVLEGIMKMDYETKDGNYGGIDHEIENIAHYLKEMSLDQDKEILDAFWEKARDTPRGWLTSSEWIPFVNYIVKNDDESFRALTNEKEVRDNLTVTGIARILTQIRINPNECYWTKKHKFLDNATGQRMKEIFDQVFK